MIELRDITWDNFWDVINLKPMETQKNNLLSNAVFMAQAYVNLKLQYQDICFAIYYGGNLIGFTKIVFVEENEETYNFNEETYFIDALMIDERYQGKGYGGLALTQILAYIRTKPWGHASSIKLSCYDGNTNAAKLSEKFGFTRTDEFVLGKEGLRLYTMKG